MNLDPNKIFFILFVTVLTIVISLPTTTLAKTENNFVFISGNLNDPFFTAIKKGADAAAHDLNVNYKYLPTEIDASKLTKAIRRAASMDPEGIAYGDWYPKVEDPLISDLAKKGVAIVGYNSGPENWQEKTKAIAWVKQPSFKAGYLIGEKLAKKGVTHGLCVNHAPGSTLFEERCNGFKKGIKNAGGKVTELSIPYDFSSNPGKVEAAIRGALSKHKDIDGILTLGSSIAIFALNTIKKMDESKKIKVVTFDLSKTVLQKISESKLLFAVDQQPYLQGYYALLALVQYVKYGLHPTETILVGPRFINKSNVRKTLKVVKSHPGIRGAR